MIGAIYSLAAYEIGYSIVYRQEKKGSALFIAPDIGVRVLDIIPGSHAEKMKLEKGDIILKINGMTVQTEAGVKAILEKRPTFIWMYTEGLDGRTKVYEYKCYPQGVTSLGIITVPRSMDVTYTIEYFNNYTVIRDIVDKFRSFKG